MSRVALAQHLRTLIVGGLLACIILAAVMLRASDLGRNYLEANEGGTFFLSMAPLDKYFVWGGTESDFTGAESEWNGILAYYGLFRGAQHWLGMDEFSLRFIPMVCGVLGIAAIFFLGRRWGGDSCGLLAALCLALNAEHIDLSRYYRFNSLSVLIAILSTYALAVAVQKRKRCWWWVYWVSSVMCLWSMMLSAFLLPAHWLYILLSAETAGERKRLLQSVLIAGLAILPSRFFDDKALARIYWYPHLSWERFSELWSVTVSVWNELAGQAVFAYLVLYACLLLGLALSLRSWLGLGRRFAERIDCTAVLAGWRYWELLAWLGAGALAVLLLSASADSLFGHDTTLMYDQGLNKAISGLTDTDAWRRFALDWHQRGGWLASLLLEAALLHWLLGLLPSGCLDRLQKRWPKYDWKAVAAWGRCVADSSEWALPLLWLLVPGLGMCLCTLLIKPILLTRNVCFIIPAVSLLIGLGFARCNAGGKVVALLCLWFACPQLTYGTCEHLDAVPEMLNGWSPLIEVIHKEARDGDCVILKSVNGPTYRYYVYLASRYRRFPAVKVWPEFAWNGSPCPMVAFRYGQEFVRRIRPEQRLWVIHDEPWFSIMRLSDEDLEGFSVKKRWYFSFGMQLTELQRDER
ncbi:glycosyltransferase family 39 protein [bacterium]|nr:glycosyltransferase family 39 protein [bacterium]